MISLSIISLIVSVNYGTEKTFFMVKERCLLSTYGIQTWIFTAVRLTVFQSTLEDTLSQTQIMTTNVSCSFVVFMLLGNVVDV